MVKLLRDAGFTPEQGKGDHEVEQARPRGARHHHAAARGLAGTDAQGTQGDRRGEGNGAVSTSIDVTATRWSGGWELAIDDDPITQVRHLEDAPQQVRDYLDTEDPTTDHSDVIVEVHVDLGEDLDEDLGERIESSRAAAREAHERQVEAAKQVRTVVRTLRANSVSVADVATILGVSRGRVSQLAKESAAVEASEGDAAATIPSTRCGWTSSFNCRRRCSAPPA